jgi:hypothetical protein
VITGAAFCPHPPALLPDVARGAAPELADLREACRVAIQRVAAPGTTLLLLGAGDVTRRRAAAARGSLAGYGVELTVSLGSGGDGPGGDGVAERPEELADELPLSLTVGAWLVADALVDRPAVQAWSIGAAGGPIDVPDAPTALVVLGDGSARRSLAAPGYLDERAEGFDAGVATALAGGDPAALRVDRELGTQLLAAGTPVWHAAADLLAGTRWSADLLYDAAPYGVGYFAAAWTGG